MNELEKKGKLRTIQISISILLVSLYTIYYYNYVFPEVETRKIIQQIARFVFTVFLLVMIYKGKNWSRILAIILFTLAILGALWGVFFIKQDIQTKVPFLVMILIYSLSIYHFVFSKSFKAFASYQRKSLLE